MKWPKSILGLVLASCYLVGAAVIIKGFECGSGDWFLCGKTLGALIAALPWTYLFLNNMGELHTMIAASVVGIAVNAVIVYMCGWGVERAWKARRRT